MPVRGGDMAPRREACLTPLGHTPAGTVQGGWRKRVISRHGELSPATGRDGRLAQARYLPPRSLFSRHTE